ncbi:MAG: sugar ABC transporter ATP-binding protein [Treponema sp.]|jgi:ABC-type sugar transport system ATPase subunit|nr:sugar ABC transporter ATP-binding protein [Treponema sp.]
MPEFDQGAPLGAALEMRHVSKAFPGTLAVDDVSFSVKPGEVHALVGENGAGKSTLMKIMAGSFSDYTGEVFVGGRPVALHSPSAAKEYGIGMIYQELSLARPISVAENLLAGRLPRIKGSPFVDWKAVERESKALLSRVGLDQLDIHISISEISQCEAQLVEIAKVLGGNPSVLVMDEPTSALSSAEVLRLFGIIRQLKSQGIAIAYISHHIQEIFDIADTITVMRDGRHVRTCGVGEVTSGDIVEMMVGRSIEKFYSKRAVRIGNELFRVEKLSRYGFFHDVSLKVHEGEILGVCGLAGAGRTELARSIIGVDPLDAGDIYLWGEKINVRNMSEAIEKGVVYLTESRKTDGLALALSVAENCLSTIIPRLSRGPFYSGRKNKGRVSDLIDKLVIYPKNTDLLVSNLSGGNQQKVLMAKWIASSPKVMILDEPTRGVDIGAKEIIHGAISELAAQGNGVILFTSDLPEMVGLCDRVAIMRQGHIIGEIDKENMSEGSLLLAANGEGKFVA